MFFEMLQCRRRQCKASLATGDHNIRSNLIPAEPHTIEEFQHAHNRFMHHYREFVRKNQEKHLVLLAGTMSTATLNLFYASEDFKNFEDEYVDGVGTNSAKLGDRYKGLLVDQLTPLEHYLVDILHFKIIIANILMNNVILPLAQEIEDLHHGQGVWAFSAASKGSGLKHFGMRMKEYALVSKKIFTEGCEAVKSPASEPAPRNARIVRQFLDNFLPSWSKSEMKIALWRLTSLGDIINRLDKSALLRELKLAFGKMCADDVVKTWIPP